MSADDLTPLRTRAYQLVDTGRYPDWGSIAAALMDEGAIPVLVRRAGDDALFKVMLANRIKAAEEA